MPDRVSPEKRSEIMSGVRSTGSKIERAFASLLTEQEIEKCVKHSSDILGKPDFAFPDVKLAIFIDSCFWHGCDEHLRMPASNREYWVKKVERNRQRDQGVNEALVGQGWKVIRIWEHDLKDKTTMEKRLREIRRILASESLPLSI